MPRSLTAPALRSILARETAEVWLLLLTIEHPLLNPPLRAVHNDKDIPSRGNTFVAFPFRIAMPSESKTLARVQIVIDNIDQKIATALDSVREDVTVTMEVVLASSPDTLEAGPLEMGLINARGNRLAVEGTLAFEPILEINYPSGKFTPKDFPAMFR